MHLNQSANNCSPEFAVDRKLHTPSDVSHTHSIQSIHLYMPNHRIVRIAQSQFQLQEQRTNCISPKFAFSLRSMCIESKYSPSSIVLYLFFLISFRFFYLESVTGTGYSETWWSCGCIQVDIRVRDPTNGLSALRVVYRSKPHKAIFSNKHIYIHIFLECFEWKMGLRSGRAHCVQKFN